MRPTVFARGLVIACALVVLTPGTGQAITWSPVRPITVSGQAAAFGGAMTVTGTSGVQIAYREWVNDTAQAYFRRSTDGGTTWSNPAKLNGGSAGTCPALASQGSVIRATWTELRADGTFRIMYRRSPDAGKTWETSKAVASLAVDGACPRIASDGAGRVAVTWTHPTTGKVYVRISGNGGTTWAAAKVLGTSTNAPWSGDTSREAFPVVAMGNGVIHVAFYANGDTLVTRRSSNSGATWSAAATLATNTYGISLTLAAAGKSVIVGYAAYATNDAWTVYRRSTDSGAHWAAAVSLSPKSGNVSFSPIVSYKGGVWRAAFEKCNADCSLSATYFRQSSDGITWTSASRVTPTSLEFASPVGVNASSSRSVVAFMSYDSDANAFNVSVRQGS